MTIKTDKPQTKTTHISVCNYCPNPGHKDYQNRNPII